MSQCRKLSGDHLQCLSRATEMQCQLDMCSTGSGQSEILRGIDALSSCVASSTNLLSAFGDVCSAPLSGIDRGCTIGSFACETDWQNLLLSTTSRSLTAIENQLLSLSTECSDLVENCAASYVSENLEFLASLDSSTFNKAACTLTCLKSLTVRGRPMKFFPREGALDYLPILRGINASEEERRKSSTRRRCVLSHLSYY